MKSLRRILSLFVLVLLVAGCSDDDEQTFDTIQNPSVCDEPTGDDGQDIILSGRIEREKTDFSYNDDIQFTEDAHVAVTIRRYEGEDAAAPLTFSADVAFTGFPFAFTLRGDAAKAFDGGADDADQFLVNVEILNHEGCDTRVGDLVNETFDAVSGPQTDYTIKVQGLEACGSENSGGFCVGQ